MITGRSTSWRNDCVIHEIITITLPEKNAAGAEINESSAKAIAQYIVPTRDAGREMQCELVERSERLFARIVWMLEVVHTVVISSI